MHINEIIAKQLERMWNDLWPFARNKHSDFKLNLFVDFFYILISVPAVWVLGPRLYEIDPTKGWLTFPLIASFLFNVPYRQIVDCKKKYQRRLAPQS